MSAEPLLEIRDLTVTYRRGRGRPPLTALNNVDLTVAPGETLSVVGESGSGKTTLGKAVLGLVPPTAGSIHFAGEDITAASTRRRRQLTENIQVVFQDPHGSLNPARTVGQTLEEPLLAHRTMSRAERRAEVAAALDRVGLDHDAASRYPAEFSGGQLQRIAIARALMLSPRLLVCDEAVSALDLSIQAQILNLLRQLQRDLGLSYLFISHDLAVVRHVSDRVAVLYHGRLMETGTASDVCDQPVHPYTRALLASAPVPDPVEQRRRRADELAAKHTDPSPRTDTGCPFRDRCSYALDRCADPLPIHHRRSGLVACHRYGELGTEGSDRLPEGRGERPASEPLARTSAQTTADGSGLDGPVRSDQFRQTPQPRRTPAR
ncbi:MAG TPA: oligopeptide/dipeptide ABC transporter ATP-binding protein [Actinomycetes bacterium]|nr:oligopeptide/dipeptide ABC transporter ATP-binding protein [Actinomycetes bacterium]